MTATGSESVYCIPPIAGEAAAALRAGMSGEAVRKALQSLVEEHLTGYEVCAGKLPEYREAAAVRLAELSVLDSSYAGKFRGRVEVVLRGRNATKVTEDASKLFLLFPLENYTAAGIVFSLLSGGGSCRFSTREEHGAEKTTAQFLIGFEVWMPGSTITAPSIAGAAEAVFPDCVELERALTGYLGGLMNLDVDREIFRNLIPAHLTGGYCVRLVSESHLLLEREECEFLLYGKGQDGDALRRKFSAVLQTFARDETTALEIAGREYGCSFQSRDGARYSLLADGGECKSEGVLVFHAVIAV